MELSCLRIPFRYWDDFMRLFRYITLLPTYIIGYSVLIQRWFLWSKIYKQLFPETPQINKVNKICTGEILISTKQKDGEKSKLITDIQKFW